MPSPATHAANGRDNDQDSGVKPVSEQGHVSTEAFVSLAPRANEARRRYLMACVHGKCDPEEGRALLQERLALVSKVAALLSGFAFVASQGLMATTAGHSFFGCLHEHGTLWHLAAIGVAVAVWLVTSRGRYSFGTLVALDFGGLFLAVSAYALMTATGSLLVPQRLDLAIMLITMSVVTLRAVIVPSRAGHTVAVSSIATLPVFYVTYNYGGNWSPSFPVTPLMATFYIGVWCVIAVAIAGVASHIIYGLRNQASLAQRLGQYVLEEKIGEGGMGAVYRASHALLRRATAVKLLPPEKAGARNLARFEREVQLTAMLTHPNTVNIFDYGRTPQGVFYYAMEYLDGINLEELVIAYGPLEPARVIHILEQVCGSLSEAHAIGLVHRDIKPANIILCERGGIADTAKVVDFGLVKDIGAPQNGGSGLSQINTLLGTPLYMAPETITAPDRIDARSDLYALGAVAYFLLTGEPPFVGASVLEVCAKHLHETPLAPSLRLGRPLPPDLEAIVLACLAKKPEARPESAAVLGEALLACDLPRWSAAQARAWWDQEGAHARSIRPKPEPQSPQLLSTIAFDAESELYRAAAQ